MATLKETVKNNSIHAIYFFSLHVLGYLLLSAVVLGTASTAAGTIVYVRPAGSGAGTSWGDAFGTVQAAVDAAGPGDEIWIAAGTYTAATNPVVTLKPGVSLYGGFTGTESSRDARDIAANETCISGQNERRCLLGANNTVVDGLTIQYGKDTSGGGMYAENATLTLSQCTFKNNQATSMGGGAYIKGGAPTISNCAFNNNSAVAGGGGMANDSARATVSACTFLNNTSGEYAGALDSDYSTSTISGCTFEGNTAGTRGGAMEHRQANVTVVECLFKNNGSAGSSGGIDNYKSTTTFTDCTFQGNTAALSGGALGNNESQGVISGTTFLSNSVTQVSSTASSFGGAVANTNSTVTIDKCRFSSNTTPIQTDSNATGGYCGGGVYVSGGGITLSQCLFESNTCGVHGGGVHAYNNDGTANLINCVFWKNTSQYEGGGASLYSSTAEIINCTFYGNTSPQDNRGAGLFLFGSNHKHVVNCILWGNTAGGNPAQLYYYVGGYSCRLFVGNSCVQGSLDGLNVSESENIISTDPLLVDTGTGNFRLQPTSPCVDAGSANRTPPAVDIDDASRPQGFGYDIGAYELTPPIRRVDCNAPGDVPDGLTWATAYKDIQSAIDTPGCAEIWVAGGDYTSTAAQVIQLRNTIALYGGFGGTEETRNERSWSQNQTVIDGQNVRICVRGANQSLVDGFILQNGYSSESGGGMLNNGVSPALSNCLFRMNCALRGGGMHNVNASPVVTNCIFADNITLGEGAGMFNTGSSPALVNCTFTRNLTLLGGEDTGGAIYNDSATTGAPVVKNCILWDNSGNDYCNKTDSLTYSCVENAARIFDEAELGSRHILIQNPRLVNPAGGDYRHGGDSPCINAGTSEGAPARDFAGVSRPRGAGIDLGAFEMEPFTVTLEQASSQADPTEDVPVMFTVNFSQPVSNFTAGDITLIGTIGQAADIEITGDGTSYLLAISGIPGPGTIIPVIMPNVCEDASGNLNAPSVSVDNQVRYGKVHLNYSADANGAVSGEAEQVVFYGDSGAPVTALANEHYHFTAWSDGSTDNPRTDEQVTEDIQVTALFALDTHTVSYLADPNGSISGPTPQQVDHGFASASVTAVGNEGYHFVAWSDGATDNPRTDVNVTGDITVTASFARNQYTLTYEAAEGGTITGMAQQTIKHGNDGSPVTAVSASGHHFVAWDDGVTMNPRVDRNVTADRTLTATFLSNAIYHVKTGGSGDGSSWTKAGNLQAMVNAAQAGDEVWVARGAYKATTDPVLSLKPGVAVYGGFAGTEILREERDCEANYTSIDGEGARRCARISLEKEDSALPALLDGFTIARGAITDTGSIDETGAGLYVNRAFVHIARCRFTRNKAPLGGAAAVVNAGCVLFSNCQVDLNEAVGRGGAEGYGGGIVTANASFSAYACSFVDNTAITSGGGLAVVDYSQATLHACRFTENEATVDGGGLYVDCSVSQLANCIFLGNNADNFGGGLAVNDYIVTSNPLTFSATNCTFTGNNGTNAGGGISLSSMKLNEVTLVNNILWGNTSNAPDLAKNVLQSGSGSPILNFNCVEYLAEADGNINQNPLFVDAEAGNVRLQESSPCIDAGTEYGAPFLDVDGIERPQGAGIDMGAHEFDNTPPAVTIEQAPGQPDPTNDAPVHFVVEFSETVLGFTAEDVTVTGSAADTATVELTGAGKSFSVLVSGMSHPGTVSAVIDADSCTDIAGNGNTASSSNDNEVVYGSHTLTYTAGPGGSIVGTSPQTVFFGHTGEAVTAQADDRYHFERWSDDSLQNPRIDQTVTADIAVTAYFAVNPPDPEGEGEAPLEGEEEGELPIEGEIPAEGEGEASTEGEGETPAEGEVPAEGEGESEGEGEDEEGGCCAGGCGCSPEETSLKRWLGDYLLIGVAVMILTAFRRKP